MSLRQKIEPALQALSDDDDIPEDVKSRLEGIIDATPDRDIGQLGWCMAAMGVEILRCAEGQERANRVVYGLQSYLKS